MWTGKQVFSLIIKPNKTSPIKANLRTKGRAYTSNEELCVCDSCKLYLFCYYQLIITNYKRYYLLIIYQMYDVIFIYVFIIKVVICYIYNKHIYFITKAIVKI